MYTINNCIFNECIFNYDICIDFNIINTTFTKIYFLDYIINTSHSCINNNFYECIFYNNINNINNINNNINNNKINNKYHKILFYNIDKDKLLDIQNNQNMSDFSYINLLDNNNYNNDN